MTELFENFEVNRDSKWPIISRLVGASLIVHFVLLWLALYVPVFRDTLNIASLIANTRFVDEEYVATRIGDEVQIVELEKFRYPDGYFSTEQPGTEGLTASAANDPFAPKIISQWKPGGDVVPEASPSPSPEASPAPSASPDPSAAPSASPSAVAQNATPSPTPLTQEEAQKELEKTAAANNIPLPQENQINKKPLKDFGAHVKELEKQGKLDINKQFEVVIEAELDENAKLQNPRVTKRSGDTNLIDLFRGMVAAVNDSGLLVYLKAISEQNPGSTIRITLKQGENEVIASIESETASIPDAVKLAKGLNGALFLGAVSRAGKDEAELMKNTTATNDGRKVLVNFAMPRQTVMNMIKKQMEPGE